MDENDEDEVDGLYQPVRKKNVFNIPV